NFWERLERIGHVPLPPYIRREDRPEDAARYQTVYARSAGSVAAPTAGLHFTTDMLGRLQELGVEIAEVTLHVGLGTFQPIHTELVEEHRMHSERYQMPEATVTAVNRAIDQGRRVVAVGTTTVRALEQAGRHTGRVSGGEGETSLFIYPGYEFHVAGAMITN